MSVNAGRVVGEFFRRLSLLVFVVGALLQANPPATARAASLAGPIERWGFYVTYDATSRDSLLRHLDALDVVVPDYFNLQASGVVEGERDATIDSAIAAAGKLNLPMVQNRIASGALTPFLTDPERRASVVAGITRQVAPSQFAGATLDFEGVNPTDRTALTQFVRDLGASLHGTGKLLAVAVPAGTGDPTAQWSGAFDDQAIGAAADRVILMAYAYRTENATTPGPISPLPWVASVSAFASSAIPPGKLVLGIGVWGYDWAVNAPGRATALRYDEIAKLMTSTRGQLTSHVADASAEYAYQTGGQTHQVWFETAATIQQKATVATQGQYRGVAFWRLGQEDPSTWAIGKETSSPDYALPNGWYYLETGSGSGLGYRVYDDAIRFWSEFKRLGGVATLGYPASRRYVGADGFTYQVFQRGILQWRPELGVAFLGNTFDQLTAAGQDQLLAQEGIPAPILDDGSGGDWKLARQIRLGWLTQPEVARAFYANPNPSALWGWNVDAAIQLYGLPSSRSVRDGPFIVQRFQRISLQLWLDSVPGMPPSGTVVGILGGDLVKRAGIVPTVAAEPEPPG